MVTPAAVDHLDMALPVFSHVHKRVEELRDHILDM